jgi:hypothetical protein
MEKLEPLCIAGGNILQSLWKTGVSSTVKQDLTTESSSSTPEYISKRIKNRDSK